MTHHCDHHHHQHADSWTKINAGGSALTGYISSAFWFANLFDVISGFEGTEYLPVSWAALGVGLGLSLLTTTGSTYSHYILNKSHQSNHDHEADLETQPLIENHRKKLSFKENMALTGDFIDHVGEVAGPITFIVDLASRNRFERTTKFIIHSSAAFFGALVSVAPVRTCRNNMLKS